LLDELHYALSFLKNNPDVFQATPQIPPSGFSTDTHIKLDGSSLLQLDCKRKKKIDDNADAINAAFAAIFETKIDDDAAADVFETKIDGDNDAAAKVVNNDKDSTLHAIIQPLRVKIIKSHPVDDTDDTKLSVENNKTSDEKVSFSNDSLNSST